MSGRNANVQVLASAARTATTTSDWVDNPYHNSAYIIIDCTADPAAAAHTPTVEGYDAVSGKAYVIATLAVVNGVATYVDLVGSKVAAAEADGAGVRAAHDLPLPRKWRVVMTAADADSITYSVAAAHVNG